MSVLQITPAERTALQMLADGLAHHEIASSLRISECVLDAELRTLFERMGVLGRNQAIADAVRRGVVFTQTQCQEPGETCEHPGDERGANRLGDGGPSVPTANDLDRQDAAAQSIAAACETTQAPG
jgi:DNA-binding CsgD family transcriptional regulator